MEVTRIRALRGPNLWSRHTCIEAIVACTRRRERRSSACPASKPACARCSRPSASCTRSCSASRSRWPMCSRTRPLALQAQAGCAVNFGHTARTHRRRRLPGHRPVQRRSRRPARARTGRAADRRRAEPTPPSTPRRHHRTARPRRIRAPGPEHRLHRRCGGGARHPVPPPDQRQPGAVRLGLASSAASRPPRSTAPAASPKSIAQDKELTKQLLNAAGVPVPLGRPVSDAEDGWAAAQEIGLPVVVKPQDGNQGKGVTVNITTREQLIAAYDSAAEYGEGDGREVPARLRLPPAGGRRPAGRRRAPRSAAGDRRWRAHRARAGRRGQPGPAPRRRPCDLAHQDPARRHRHRPPAKRRASRPTACPRAASAWCCATTPTSRPAAPPPT